jgi:hypothetical protein
LEWGAQDFAEALVHSSLDYLDNRGGLL